MTPTISRSYNCEDCSLYGYTRSWIEKHLSIDHNCHPGLVSLVLSTLSD